MFTSFIDSNALTVTQFATCLAASLFCGFVIAGAYTIKNTYSKSFISSIVLLPAIIQTIILLVNGNLGTGVAIMGGVLARPLSQHPGHKQGNVDDLFSDGGWPGDRYGTNRLRLVFYGRDERAVRCPPSFPLWRNAGKA